MSHRLRRRIIRDLILAGNIGLTSTLATQVVTFVQTGGDEGNTLKLEPALAKSGQE